MAGIKTLELDPSKDKNTFKTLVTDAVGRNKNLWQFACFCSAQESKCSIALDGGWGTGKTFFLHQLIMIFDAYGDQTEQLNEAEQKQIQQLFNSYAAEDQLGMTIRHHDCVYYDAWLNDNANDPLHSILYELIKQTKKKFVKNGKGDYWKAACTIFDAFTGKNTSSLRELAEETNPVHDIKKQQSFHKDFKNYLDNLIPRGYGRLLVLIDELDRCKPSYAVQLLERIKHYLSNDKITFVFAVNKEQLLQTIKAFYGDDFDAYQYLDRFFDFSLSLPQPDRRLFNSSYGLDQSGKDFDTRLYADVFNAFVRVYNLSLRDATRYWLWVKLACQSFKNEKEKNDNISWKFVMYIVVPVVIGLKLSNKKEYDDFLNGKIMDPLLNVLKNGPIANRFLEHPFDALKEKHFDPEKIQWDIMPFTEAIYIELFAEEEFAQKKILDPLPYDTSPFVFNQEMKDTIFTASNLMADFIKYDTNTEMRAN